LQYLENDTNIILKIASAYYSLKDYKNVIDIYTKLKREEIMDSFEYSRQLGWAYYYTGQEKEAAEYLANAALKSNDNNFILQIAQLSEKYLDTNKSIELYVLARNLVKNNDLNYKLAELFLKNNDLVNAANQYSIYLSTNPKNIEVLEKCADLYFQLSYVNDAIKLYNQLISLDKNKIKAYQRLGDLYVRLNDFKNAAANYEKYIMSNKSDNQAILTLARLLFKIEDYKKTIDAYKMLNFETLAADDKKTFGLAYFRLALATIDKKQAGYYFKEAFEIMKNEEYALEYIQQLSLRSAEYYFDADLFDSAILSAKKYLQFNKTNFEIYYLLAKSFDNLKKTDSAVVYYYLCSLLDNTRNDVNKKLGLLLENKDPLLAAHYFEKYLQAINNNDAEIYLKTANLLFANKNYEKAYNYYSRLDLTKNKEYFDNIIECLIKLDNKSAAVEYILKKYKSDNKIKLEDLEYALKYYFENQNYVEIKRLVDTLPEIYKKQLTELNFIVGYTYWLSKELTNAAEYFLEFERKTADIKNFADYAYYLAEIYFSKNDLKKAGEYYEKFFKYHTNEKALNNRLSEKNIIDIRLKFVKILLELGDSKNIEQYIQQIIDKIELVEEKSKRDAYLIIGEYFLNNNNLNKAEEYFSLAKKSGANVIVPYTLLGLKYYEIKNFEKSQNFLNEAAGISDDPRVYQILGDIAISKNDTASAERNYLYLYSKAPSEENALILARLYRKSNNNIKAIEYYKFALNYNPKNSECLKYLGDAYFDLKNYELADRYLSVLFNLDQNKETILSKLAKSNFELGNFEKCAEYSGKLNNLRAEQMYEYGYSLYKIRKKIEALKIFDDLLQKGISANLKFQVLRLAADLYNELNSKIDARLIGYYEEMIKIHNDGTYKIEDANYFDKIVQQIAKFYFSITDYAKSYLYYSQIKKQSSLDNENYFNFAISAFHLKKYSEALQLFNSMSVKTKLPANNYKYTVVSYYYLNNFDNAYADLKKYFDAGLTAAPDIENFNKIAGKILYYKNDYNKAAEFLNRIYATNKNDTEILNLLGYIDLNNGKKTDALQKFENSLNINNNQWEILMTAGDLNYEINRFDNAARYYTKLQDLKTLDTSKSDIQKKLNDRILKLANIYYTKGLFRKSYEILSAYNQKYQNLEDFRIYYNSALAAMKVGKFDEADKLFEKSEKFNIKNSTYYQQYGLLSYKLKKYDRALLNVQKAVNLEPTNIDYMILLAEIYETGGNIKETVKIYERIYTLKNNDLKIINKLADLYYDSNNHQKAYELYLLSIKLDPTSDYASKAAQRLNELKKNLN